LPFTCLPRASPAHFRFPREGSTLIGKGHQPVAPARRGGPARPCDSSVFPATSAISVLIPALSPKNPSFVFIRLRTLSFSVYNIFPFKRFAFNPFRTLSIAMGVEGYFFRIRKAMRTPRSAAPRGLSNFVSGISSRVHSDFRFRLPPSAPCACLPNVLHSPPPSSSPAAAPP